MSQLTSSSFWIYTAERAIKTAAQAALLTFGADQVNALDANWVAVAGMAAGGAIISVLTSFASVQVTGYTDPSIV